MDEATDRLAALLAPPDLSSAQQAARRHLSQQQLPLHSPAQLGHQLEQLLKEQQADAARLEQQLSEHTQETHRLVGETRTRAARIKDKSRTLKDNHHQLEHALAQAKSKLVTGLEARDPSANEEEEGVGLTLRERLVSLAERRQQLVAAQKWFGAVANAEQLGLTALRSLESNTLPQAFRAYVEMVTFVRNVDKEATEAQSGDGHSASKTLSTLTSQLVAMTTSVWSALVKTLSSRLLEKLETLGWPQPFAEALDPYEDQRVADFQRAFVDLLTLEHLQANNPIPTSNKLSQSVSTSSSSSRPKPLLALQPLVHPLLLRFKWQFEGSRGTNRIDKPEYPLSHVLNLLTAHERFLGEDIQYLLDTNGFEHIDAVNEFTSLLLPPLVARLRHHLPQLLSMPPVLAHTVYQVVEFDQQLRSRGYKPRTWPTVLKPEEEGSLPEEEGEWEGLSETILGRQEWFEKWIDGEREFFDKRYFDAIGAPDAWHIIPEEDFDAGESTSGTRPTHSALRVKELAEQLADRYRPLPLRHTPAFLLSLHLPLLQSYAARITSALDAFESLSFGILPGALGQTTAATAGVGGAVRLIRAGVSARWMGETCAEWGEDAFFLTLYEYLSTVLSTPGRLDDDLQEAAEDVLDNSEGTVFDRERTTFENLAERSEELIVRHAAREVINELKAYFGRRWDVPADEDDSSDRSLSPELIAPLSLFSSLLATIVQSFPQATRTTLYRRIAALVSQALYDRLLASHGWTETAAHQFQYDVENGFLVAAREAGIPERGLQRGWEVARGGGIILSLPAQASQQGGYVPGGELTFSQVMSVVFDDDSVRTAGGDEDEDTPFGSLMAELGIGEGLTRSEVQQLMRRRPECWR
ncbi:hypothetical protein JCM10908_002971 [Rhodotorula pacifica]|uniref:uncharacterized protein n=1 Tax=Rhodotorula pacifica TaxID=1495444 RepID=UPI00317124A9